MADSWKSVSYRSFKRKLFDENIMTENQPSQSSPNPNRYWALTGIPLLTIGSISFLISFSFSSTPPQAVFMTIGLVYISSSLLLLTKTERAKSFAVYAWYPMYLISTRLAENAITAIDGNFGESNKTKELGSDWNLDDLIKRVSETAISTFSINEEELEMELIEDLKIAPGEIDRFLDDLDIDYGFPISSDDRKHVSTIEDIIALIAKRMKNESDQTPQTIPEAAPPTSRDVGDIQS